MKKDVLQRPNLFRISLCQLYLVHQLSSLKLFSGVKFRDVKLYYKTRSVSTRRKSIKIRLFYHKLNCRRKGNSLSVYHGNSNDQRGKLDRN